MTLADGVDDNAGIYVRQTIPSHIVRLVPRTCGTHAELEVQAKSVGER